VAVDHSRLLLRGNDQVAVIQADLRDVGGIFDHPETRRLLDLDQPIGLSMLLLLHFVPDSWDPVGILARYRDRLAYGSYLALSQVTSEGNPAGLAEAVQLPGHAEPADPPQPRGATALVRRF